MKKSKKNSAAKEQAYDRVDNWSEFGYVNARYLDAMASLLCFTKPCSAALEEEGNIVVSYNRSLAKASTQKYEARYFESIVKFLCDDNTDSTKLVGVYILVNVDFVENLKTIVRANKKSNEELYNTFNPLLELLRQTKQKLDNIVIKDKECLKNNEYFTDQTLNINNLVGQYCALLNYLHENQINQYWEELFRPLQDCEKLIFCKNNFVNKEIKYVDNDNVNELHAEYNLAEKYPQNLSYKGISKLSCGYCHHELEEAEHLHRGTHGICDLGWKPEAKREEVKKKLTITELGGAKDLVFQHRKLSFDKFESKIEIVSEIILKPFNVQEKVTLEGLKTLIRITGEYKDLENYNNIYSDNINFVDYYEDL